MKKLHLGAIRDTRGLVKMVADADAEEVLGVTMIGQGAGEVIHEAAMGLRFRATLRDFIDLIHAYPTMAEALKIAAISRYKDPAKLSCCAESSRHTRPKEHTKMNRVLLWSSIPAALLVAALAGCGCCNSPDDASVTEVPQRPKTTAPERAPAPASEAAADTRTVVLHVAGMLTTEKVAQRRK